MGKKIHDEFSSLQVSRQRKYQLRKKKLKLCQECGGKRLTGTHCRKCAIAHREHQRRRINSKKRYLNCLTYAEDKPLDGGTID